MKVWSVLGAIVWQDTGRRLAMRDLAALDAVALPRLGDGLCCAGTLESTGPESQPRNTLELLDQAARLPCCSINSSIWLRSTSSVVLYRPT